MSITVSREEVKGFEKLKAISQIAPISLKDLESIISILQKSKNLKR